MRRVKQIGVDYVLTGGPRIPWTEADIRARIDQFKAGGLTLYNLMISGFNDVIWGRPGADAQIDDVIASIRAAGKGRTAGHRIQLLRESSDGRLQGGDRARRRRLHGVRLRAVEGPPAARRGGHAHARRAAEARRALPESGRARGGEGQRPARPASQRSAGAAQPRLRADHGDVRALEAVPRTW